MNDSSLLIMLLFSGGAYFLFPRFIRLLKLFFRVIVVEFINRFSVSSHLILFRYFITLSRNR